MVSFVFLFLVVAVPLIAYQFYGGSKSSVWGLVPEGKGDGTGGVYRAAGAMLWKPGEAPPSVRVAALSSFFLGQMIVPGALAALLGVFILFTSGHFGPEGVLLVALLLSAPTGILVAVYLLSAGKAMLTRSADAGVKAGRAWRAAVTHNLVLLAGVAASAVAVGAAGNAGDAVGVAVGASIYPLISIAQALLVRRAAADIEAYAARQGEEPEPDSTGNVAPAA